jgi:hypothetical protein
MRRGQRRDGARLQLYATMLIGIGASKHHRSLNLAFRKLLAFSRLDARCANLHIIERSLISCWY